MKRRKLAEPTSVSANMNKRILKRLFSFAMAAVMTCTAAGCGKSEDKKSDGPSARVTVDGTKFMVDGKELWINGVNTPWQKWNDFGGDMDEAFWDKTFAQLAEDTPVPYAACWRKNLRLYAAGRRKMWMRTRKNTICTSY